MNSKINRGLIATLLLAAFVLSACAAATPTEDPAVKITQIAATIQAEFTQNAALTPSATPTLAATATATLEPATATPAITEAFPTPTATVPVNIQGSTDDKAIYVSDVTIPDGTIVKPGSTFIKTWAIRNTGKTTWLTAFRLSYLEGVKDAKEMLYVHMPKEVKPEETVNVSITFKAPDTFGTYYSYWRMVNFEGVPFGEQMSMKIVVGNP